MKGGKLVVANRRLDLMTLEPSAKESFAGTGGVTFVFERDRNGQVIAFYAGNGRARDIRFARVR